MVSQGISLEIAHNVLSTLLTRIREMEMTRAELKGLSLAEHDQHRSVHPLRTGASYINVYAQD